MSVSMTKKELSELAGYTYRHMHSIDRDLSEDEKLFVEDEDGMYDLAVFIQRWADYRAGCGQIRMEKHLRYVHEHESRFLTGRRR